MINKFLDYVFKMKKGTMRVIVAAISLSMRLL
jgi:hypothetical protein